MIESLSYITASDLSFLETQYNSESNINVATFEEFVKNLDNKISEATNNYSKSSDIFPAHDFKAKYFNELINNFYDNSNSVTENTTNVSDTNTVATIDFNSAISSNSGHGTVSNSSVSSSKYNIPSSSHLANTTYDKFISRMADKYEVPFDLIKRVIKTESSFNAKATSSSGAMGLMQLMPATAKWLGVENVYSAEENIEGGTKYLSKLLKKYGDVTLAVAAYNAGPGNVDKYNGVPPFAETQNYVKKILG